MVLSKQEPWKLCLSLAVVLVSLQICSTSQDGNIDAPTVETPDAVYHGKRIEFRPHQIPDFAANVAAYTRIPYAEPPVGELRFKRPVAKAAKGDYDATKPLKGCSQVSMPGIENMISTEASEDCLYLDVYVPEPKPLGAAVMVWIHSGGFIIGAGSLEKTLPIPLVALNDVIVVTMNYRLGAFGFLATGDGEIPGNMGLLDQRQALIWVQENIEAFGGDANRVTIFGESAGSWSVSYHIMSPLSAGLFSRGIMQSGVATLPGVCASMKDVEQATWAMGSAANCDADDTADLVACLRQKTAEELVSIMQDGEFLFHSTVDNFFLPKSVADIAADGEFNNVEVMVGYLSEEGTSFVTWGPDGIDASAKPTWNRTIFEGTLYGIMAMANVGAVDEVVIESINYVYSSAEDLARPEERDYVDAAIDFFGDNTFGCPVAKLIDQLVNAGRTVYPYVMTHAPSHPYWGSKATWMGATHGEDVVYVFGSALMIDADDDGDSEGRGGFNELEVDMSRQVMKYWSNFAKTGDPNRSSRANISPEDSKFPEWMKATKDEARYKEISLTFPNFIGHPFPKRCHFQLEILPRLQANAAELERLKSLLESEVDADSQRTCEDPESCPES